MLAPLLINIFLATMYYVAFTRFEAGKDIVDALVSLIKEKREDGRGEATAGDPASVTSLRGMLYVDTAAVISQSPEQFRKMIVVIVTLCTVFGLIVLKAKHIYKSIKSQ